MDQTFSPPAILEKFELGERNFFVVRDDLLPGGSKQRACGEMLQEFSKGGFESFVYASPFAGFAQVALAFVGSVLGFKIHIICERDRGPKPELDGKHRFTRLAEKYGAQITLVDTLAQAETKAFQEASMKIAKIPLGFSCKEFSQAFERELALQWAEISKQIGEAPRTIWLPVGSGTLLGVFKRILKPAMQIKAVNVGVLSDFDQRISQISRDLGSSFFKAPESFFEVAERPPKIPSNIHYDAKLWRFICAHGQCNDLWWNVAQ